MTFNRNQIGRRNFIAGSALLALCPRSLSAQNENDVLLRMAVMSDVHFNGRPDAEEVKRFARALSFMNDWSAKQPYPKFDALLVAGDMSNNGTEDQIGLFKKTMDAGIRSGTQTILCMGNHEFYGGDHDLWQKIFGVQDNARYKVNGFSVIALSPEKGNGKTGDYAYRLDWLRGELDKACAEDPQKPIFLIQHYHISETVYGSLHGDDWGTADLVELLKNYPTVIDFSGHSHYPINDPRSAWQGVFTAFGTGTLSYFEMEGGHYDKFPPGYRAAAQFYVVEVHRDNSVVVRPYDLITNSFFDIVYRVAEPGSAATYLYTDKRYETAAKPVWKEPASVTLENPTCFGATFRFPQARDETVVHSYRIDFEKISDGGTEKEEPFYAWSQYYFNAMPDPFTVEVDTLEPSGNYRAAITAINPFGKESDKKLTAEFQTPADADDSTDRAASAPEANVLNILFEKKGAANRPVGIARCVKPVETCGEPKIFYDETLGAFAASFDGVKDALKIAFSRVDYARIRRRVTLGARFRFENWPKNTAAIVANTEQGGYSLELNAETKRLEFWIHLAGRYLILSAECEPGRWNTAFGVYDGKSAALFIDGRPVAQKPASGRITYTANEKATAFFVGADVNRDGNGSSFFRGDIAFARVFDWALTPDQMKNLPRE